MPFINYPRREITFKIVYYGPGLCGKTTNLQYIHQRLDPERKGQLIKLDTDTERTLFFDFLPFEAGTVRGFKARFQLYTVPGQVFYNATRKMVLRRLDGCVFVADSQFARMDSNLESMENLKENLQEQGTSLDRIPYVVQYNKRDMPNVVPVEEMRAALNPAGVPDFEAVALKGIGVFETLKAVSRMVLKEAVRSAGGPGGRR